MSNEPKMLRISAALNERLKKHAQRANLSRTQLAEKIFGQAFDQMEAKTPLMPLEIISHVAKDLSTPRGSESPLEQRIAALERALEKYTAVMEGAAAQKKAARKRAA